MNGCGCYLFTSFLLHLSVTEDSDFYNYKYGYCMSSVSDVHTKKKIIAVDKWYD